MTMTMEDFYWAWIDLANGLMTGATLGGYYALISVGLALSFGVMKLVNLSHGDWLILAAYLAVVILGLYPVSPFWALLPLVPVMFLIGYALQRGLLNRVSTFAVERRGLSPIMGMMLPLLITFGISTVLSQAMQVVFSTNAQTIRNSYSFSAIALSDDLSISTLRLGFLVLAALLIGALALFILRTHIGRAIRATSDDAEIAALMGMRTAHVYGVAAGLSLMFAAFAGFMIGMSRSFQPFDGPPYLLTAFGVVVIGGLGSLGGCFLGGIALGITQVLAGTYFGPAAQQLAGYLLILLVLAARPQGLFKR